MADYIVKQHQTSDSEPRRFITLAGITLGSNLYVPDSIAIEKFSSGYLAFNAQNLSVIALDETAHEFLLQINKNRILWVTLQDLTRIYDSSEDEIAEDLVEHAISWEKAGLLKRILTLDEIEEKEMKEAKFVGNPRISCRKEEPEGAILYNPELNIFHVLNESGLEIWRSIEKPSTVKEIVYNLTRHFEDVPVEDVVADVEEFLSTLTRAEFVQEINE